MTFRFAQTVPVAAAALRCCCCACAIPWRSGELLERV